MRRNQYNTARIQAEAASIHSRLTFIAGWMLAATLALTAAAHF